MSVSLKKNTTRQKVLHAAAHQIYLYGYKGCSMRQIAEAVGIEAASIYNHFSSKAAILEAICANVADTYHQQLDLIIIKSTSNLDKLKDLISFHVSLAVAKKDFVSVLNQEWKHLEQDAYHSIRQAQISYEHKVQKILEEGIKKNEIKCADPKITVKTLLSALRALDYWIDQTKSTSTQTIASAINSLFINGLKN